MHHSENEMLAPVFVSQPLRRVAVYALVLGAAYGSGTALPKLGPDVAEAAQHWLPPVERPGQIDTALFMRDGQQLMIWRTFDHIAGRGDLLVARRRTSWHRWSRATKLGSAAASPPQFARGLDGTIAVLWKEQRRAGAQIAARLRVLRPHERSWSPPTTIFSRASSNGTDALAVGPSGEVTVVWNDPPPNGDCFGGCRLLERTLSGGTLSEIRVVSDQGGDDPLSVVVGPGGETTVGWITSPHPSFVAAVRPAGARAWGPTVPLTRTPWTFFMGGGPLSLAIDRTGTVLAAWGANILYAGEEESRSDLEIAMRAAASDQWSSPVRLAPAPNANNSNWRTVGVDSNDRFVVGVYEFLADRPEIVAYSHETDGNWKRDVLVTPSSGQDLFFWVSDQESRRSGFLVERPVRSNASTLHLIERNASDASWRKPKELGPSEALTSTEMGDSYGSDPALLLPGPDALVVAATPDNRALEVRQTFDRRFRTTFHARVYSSGPPGYRTVRFGLRSVAPWIPAAGKVEVILDRRRTSSIRVADAHATTYADLHRLRSGVHSVTLRFHANPPFKGATHSLRFRVRERVSTQR